MLKVIKLLVSIFVGLDIFVGIYFGLAYLRNAIFGQGAIPGGGSAVDMALFLLPLFIGYVAGDRLFFFLTYNERKAARLKKAAETGEVDRVETGATANPQERESIWGDRDWDDSAVEQTPEHAGN